jgi:hypothetical protein
VNACPGGNDHPAHLRRFLTAGGSRFLIVQVRQHTARILARVLAGIAI